MWKQVEEVWNYPLIEKIGASGEPLTVAQVAAALLLAALGIVLARILSAGIGRRLARKRLGPGAAHTVQKVVFYTLLFTILLTALHMLRIPVTAFAFLGGAIAIGVGFGAQNIINNFISGWILIAERPVRIHDLVEVEGFHGRVETINARCTRIRRTDGIDLLVPNSKLLENTVVNWTLVDRDIRTKVSVGIQYGSLTQQAAELIRRAVDEQESILKQPKPIVIFEQFGDNALIFDVYFWAQVNSPMELRSVESAVRFRIDALFRDADIVIAYPQRDVHLDSLSPVKVEWVEKQ